MKRYLKKQAGFALLELLIFAAILPPALLVASRASDVVSKSSQFFKSSNTRNSLNVVKTFLVTQAGNPEADGIFALPKDASGGSGGALPGSLPLSTSDEWGTTYRYCNWDLGAPNAGNPALSQNTVGAPGTGIIGQVISAGKDKTFQTACGAAAAAGDDMMVNIYNSEVLNSNGGIGGWKDNGSNVALLNPADNVGLGVDAPTHKLELAAGTLPSAGIAFGEVEIYRSAANILALSSGNSLSIDSGSLNVAGSTVIDASRNMTGNNMTLSGGLLTMNNATSNMITLGPGGAGAPTFGARSAGTKLLLWPQLGAGTVDYAQGIEGHAMWSSIPDATSGYWFKWYGGTTNIMTLDGAGHLGIGTASNTSYSVNAAGAVNASAYYLNGVLVTSVTAGVVAGQTMYWNGANWAANSGLMYDSATGAVNIAAGPLKVGGTTVIDSSRYLLGISWVAQNLNPAATNTYSLGNGTADQWLNVYAQNLYQNGNKVVDVFAGTINYIPKLTGLNTLGNSLIYDSGTNIGIGTATPGYRLDVQGATRAAVFAADTESTWASAQIYNLTGITNSARGIKFGDADGTKGAGIVGISKNTTGGRVELGFITSTGNVSYERVRVDENGNVGIGTTTPSRKLQVVGSAIFGGSGGADTTIFDQSGLGAIGTNGNYPFALFTNGAQKATLTTSGNFLLGWSNDNTYDRMQVGGAISSNTGLTATDVRTVMDGVAGASPYGRIYAYKGDASAPIPLVLGVGSGNVLMGTSTDTGGRAQIAGSGLGSFTGGGHGVMTLTTPYDGATHTAIDFNYSANSGAQARIAAKLTGAGSYLYFGTSNNYSSGITNTAMTIDPSGNVTIPTKVTTGTVFADAYTGTTTGSSYGAITVKGLNSGYTGIYLADAAGTVTGMFDAAGNGGDYDSSTGWHFYYNRANSALAIGSSATSAGYKLQVNGSQYTTGNIVSSGYISTGTALYTSGPIYRSVAGSGYLNGGYSGIETSATTGAIYSIGGGYIPTATSLNNMYGIGYAYSGNAGITVTGLPASRWGMYVASAGVSRIFLDSDNGGVYATSLVNAGVSMTAPDFYASGWFRSSTSLYGLYNSANGNFLYSEAPAYWTVTSGGSSAGGVILRDNYQGTIYGYLYHDASGFGLLHKNGGWAVRTTPTSVDLYGTTTVNGNLTATGTITGSAVYNAVYN
ncbi:beta strand repeat-containing protein [Geomonas subterranea]|uniref:beta strand repeat-containing protein n=1 Tax=Geomonas subterranea TaxID=2847989 RepID=UPI001CD7E1C4|nr:hypothetical protein [Geomonas fuzhouensis]